MGNEHDRDIQDLPLDKLEFDRRNPRLLRIESAGNELTDAEIAVSLLEGWDPKPIGRSLAEFGFFPSEPLIAFPQGSSYLVAEGNRRLLAVRLLTDTKLRRNAHASAWDEIAAHAAEKGWDFSEIPCEVVANRDEAAPVIGYRHIVGIAKWEAYDKAAFVVHLLKDGNRTFEEVSNLVGESATRVKRYLRDYLALEQAKQGGLNVEPAQDSFGRFERAMHASGIRTYVGGKSPAEMAENDEASVADPDALTRVVGYLYGKPDGRGPLFTDTRRIDDLATALASEGGREILETEGDLDRAFDAAGGRRDLVLKGLRKALDALAAISGDFASYADDAEVAQTLNQVEEAVKALLTGAQIPALPEAERQAEFDLTSETEYAEEAEETEER